MIPAAVAEAGNISVSSVCASYAGTPTVTIVADPDHVPDLPALITGLEAELRALTG